MYVYKVGVVGSGLMGAGIAQVISFAGIPVVLKDVNESILQKAMALVKAIYENRVHKGRMTLEEMQQKISYIKPVTEWEEFRDVDLVVEAIPEDLELKKKLFKELDGVCPGHAILVTNTSALSISALAAASGRADKVAGLHFFYPAPLMKLVEVIPALQTSPETVDTLLTFTEGLRKIPVRVKECAGFLVNRILMPYFCEAAHAVEEGVATVQEVDGVMMRFGMPMGPFTLADTLGLDICYHVGRVLYDAYGERMKPPDLIQRLYQSRYWGKKTGSGFYIYGEGKTTLSEVMSGKSQGNFPAERLLYLMVNEAALCLDECIATASDIDMAMLAGTGFPQDKGGLLHYADSVGVDAVLEGLKGFKEKLGPRFHPAPLLKRMVDAGYLGVKTKKGFFDYV